MKKVRLNGYFMTTRERAHRHLRRRLRLPDYYGNNLDALYDCLGDVGEPTEIELHALEQKVISVVTRPVYEDELKQC